MEIEKQVEILNECKEKGEKLSRDLEQIATEANLVSLNLITEENIEKGDYLKLINHLKEMNSASEIYYNSLKEIIERTRNENRI